MPAAVIDCGTNSTRLLIVDDQGHDIVRDLRITRLGQGVDATGRLASEAIERNIAALREFQAQIEAQGVTKVDAVATSAARDASNSDAFFDAAAEVLNLRPRLLTGVEEGRLSYAGATGRLEDKPYLVLDIGGGSTEFAYKRDGEVVSQSADLGCVRLTEKFLHSDPYKPTELEAARQTIEQWIAAAGLAATVQELAPTLVGVAGTATSLGSMHLGLTRYDPAKVHGFHLPLDGVEALYDDLVSKTENERLAMATMPTGRSDVLAAGVTIMMTVMRTLRFDFCQVSESDILDGLAMQLVGT